MKTPAQKRLDARYIALRNARRDIYERCAGTASAIASDTDDLELAARIEAALVSMAVDCLSLDVEESVP